MKSKCYLVLRRSSARVYARCVGFVNLLRACVTARSRINLFSPILDKGHPRVNRRGALALLGLVGVLTACVSGGGGGGGGGQPAPSRVGLFSHASYDFVLLNTTRAGGRNPDSEANRTLGLIYLEDAEVRARLPEGITTYHEPRYRIVPAADDPNDLTLAFFQLKQNSPSARLVFEVAERYNRRAYNLDYVVNTLGVNQLRVEANISYVDHAGVNQTLDLVSVPVTIRAVGFVPSVNAFVAFDGISQTRSEQRVDTTSSVREEAFAAGRLRATRNTTAAVNKSLEPFTALWSDAVYTADAREQTLAARADTEVASLTRAQLFAQLQTVDRVIQDLQVAVALTLNDESARPVEGVYTIRQDTNLTDIDGNSSVAGSFLAFVRGLNATTANRPLDFVALDANDNVGPNVTALDWTLTFGYAANVTRTRTSTRAVPVSSRAYTAEGDIDENIAGRAPVRGLTNVFSVLNIRTQQPAGYDRLPTLYFRVRAAQSASAARCQDAFYLDQGYRDYRAYTIKAQAGSALDHEDADAYACKLEASLRGVSDADYQDIVTTNLTDASNQTDRVTGMAAAGSPNAAACGSDNATTRLQALRMFPGCTYRAGLAIAVNDLNEPVQMAFDVTGATTYEANVGLAANVSRAGPAVGMPLNTSRGAPDLPLATFTYTEQDDMDDDGALDAVGVPVVAAVTPATVAPFGAATALRAADLFYIAPLSGANNTARLMLNASVAAAVLDYEALTANATGQRGYRVTIRATDNSTASLITNQAFNLEIQDVVYAPVDLTYAVLLMVNGTSGGVDGPPPEQHLLPGFAQFVANGGPVLGRLSARDPESNTSAGIAYHYAGVTPVDAIQNRSFVLDAADDNAPAAELLLVGPGLRDGDRFDVRLRAMHAAAPREAVVDLAVRTVVSYAAAAADNASDSSYRGAPPLRFAAGELDGLVDEGQAEAQVRNGTGQAFERRALVAGAADTPRFRLIADLGAELGGLGAAGPINRALMARRNELNDLRDTNLFTINMTTGQLALKASEAPADFTAQPVYTLLLAVANGTVTSPQDSDYALLQVAVVDNNTAPRLVNLQAGGNLGAGNTVVINASARLVTFQVAENPHAVQTLATFDVIDDNPFAERAFAPTAGASAYALERVRAPALTEVDGRMVYRAPYRLVTTRPDHEANATLDLTHVFTDGGQYVYARGRAQVLATGQGNQSLALRVNGTITDINEAPRLAFVGGTRSADGQRLLLEEDAPRNTTAVQVRAEDPERLVANLTYTLTTAPAALAAVFDVRNVSAASGRVATWPLRVADAEALENAGDGQIFTLTLTATDVAGLTASATIDLEVVDVVQAFAPGAANTTNITLSEQQALDDPNHVVRPALLRLADVQPDYDEFFFGTNVRFGDVAVEAGALRYADPAVVAGLTDEEKFNLLTLRLVGQRTQSAADDVVDLLLGEHRLIERKLLGSGVTLEVALRDPSGGVAATNVSVPVTLAPAAPVGLAFGDAADAADARAPRVPAAYDFVYQQSAYAAALTSRACAAEDRTRNITLDEQCYATVWVEDEAGRRDDYVARDARRQTHFGADANAAADRADGNRTLGIIFTDVLGRNLSIAEPVSIYELDADGNLRAARADFETYFTLTVNNSYQPAGASVPRPALLLRQKEYPVLNRTTREPIVNQTYAALDTLAIDANAGSQVLRYFIGAVDGAANAANASHRALAQLNIEVASVARRQARVEELELLGRYDLLDGETIGENEWVAVVNTLLPALRLVVANQDAAETGQSVDVVVEVVAAETSAGSDGVFDGAAGNATGNQLVRLGDNAADDFRFTLAAGAARSAPQAIPFQLARNTHGTALLRVNLTERDRNGVPLADGIQVRHYALVVEDRPARVEIQDLTVGGRSSGVDEDDAVFGMSPLVLRLLVSGAGFAPPRSQDLEAVTITATNVTGVRSLMAVGPTVRGSDTMTTRERLQELHYTDHSYGRTRFDLRLDVREPRGFANSPYDATRALSANFDIRSVPDPLTALPQRVPARYRLSQFEGELVAMARNPAEVFFEDGDLVTGAPYTAANVALLPGPEHTLAGGTGLETTLRLTRANSLGNIQPQVTRVPGTNQLRVALPDIALTLTQAQFDAIQNTPDGVVLNFTVRLTDPEAGAPVPTAEAVAQLNIRLQTYSATATPATYGTGRVTLAEGAPAGTALFVTNLTITDGDLSQPSGETYTYTLDARRNNQDVLGVLAWNHQGMGGADQRRWTETVMSVDNRTDRAIVLAKLLTDADVGVYAVTWTVRERSGGGDLDNRLVATGTFDLNITNVEDPTELYCGVTNTGRVDLGVCTYQDGDIGLQDVFGPWYAPTLDTFIDTGADVTVVFSDADLLALGDAALPRPVNVSITTSVINPTLYQGEVTSSLGSSAERGVPAAALELMDAAAVRIDATELFAVTTRLHLNLTRADYDFINQHGVASLVFDLRLTPAAGDAPEPARARLFLRAGDNEPRIVGAEIFNNTSYARPEGAPAGAFVAGDLNISDPDLARTGGEQYTYTVAGAPAGLLTWSHGLSETLRSADVQTDAQSGQPFVQRAIVFGRSPDDADVGRYMVDWTIADRNDDAGMTGARIVARGRFELNITNVAEAPVVVCDATPALAGCEGYADNQEAPVVLQEVFGNWTAPRVNTFEDTGARIQVVLSEPDDQDPLPLPANVSIANISLTGGATTQTLPAAAFNLTEVVTVDARSGAQYAVTVPLHLNLTLADYEFINQHVDANLTFHLNVTTADGAALALARLFLRAQGNNLDVTVPAAYNDALAWPEGTPAGSALAAERFRLEDPDVTRVGGDRYQYYLTVARTSDNQRPLDLLAWSHGGSETVNQTVDNRVFERAIVFERAPDDGDVGNYTVTWRIEDRNHSRASSGVAAPGGMFNLSIDNVDDPPLVYCDRVNASDGCGYGEEYLDGDAIVLQEVFGNWREPRVNDFRNTTARVTVVLAEPDFALLGSAALPPAGPVDLSIVNARLSGGGATQNIAAAAFEVSATLAHVVAMNQNTSRLRVRTAPLFLNLTQAQYDFINQHVVANLTFGLNVTTAAGATLAQARLALRATNNAPLIDCPPQGMEDHALPPCAGSITGAEVIRFGEELRGGQAGTSVGFALPIQDPDTTRAGGERYTYTVHVTDANNATVVDFVTWSHGLNEIVNHTSVGSFDRAAIAEGNIFYNGLPSFTRGLAFQRTVDDADIGNYTVNWTISNANVDGSEARIVERGAFVLAIPDRPEAPFAVCDADSPNARACGYQPAQFELNAFFAEGGRNITNINTSVVVKFAEPELLAPAPHNASLPTNLTLANGTNFLGPAADGTRTNIVIENQLKLIEGIIVRRPDAQSAVLTVEAPLYLRLSQSEYEALDLGDGLTLGFDLLLADSPGNEPPGRARAELIVTVTNVDARFNHTANYTDANIAVAEETPAQTAIIADPRFRFINITDADVLRPSGDVYTYTLTVTRTPSGAPAPDLLAWDANGTRMNVTGQPATAQWRETVRQSVDGPLGEIGLPWFQRSIVLAKQPQDEDVGEYMVRWSISDRRHERDLAEMPVAMEGALMLRIVNVNDAILACGDGVAGNCTDANLTAQATLYDLLGDFNATGILARGPVERNMTVYFRDQDFLAASVGDLALPAPDQINATVADADFLRRANITFGPARPQRLGASPDIEVIVPVRMQLNETQYAALDQERGLIYFQINVTATDAGDETLEAQTQTNNTLVVGNDAFVTAGLYDGGHLNEFRERLYANTAVFITPDPTDTMDLNVSLRIRDPDIRGIGGDTYNYTLNVTRIRDGQSVPVTNLLAWSHGASETLNQQLDDMFERTIYFVRGPASDDVGDYTVHWNITEERPGSPLPAGASVRSAASGTFTMNIKETPAVNIRSGDIGAFRIDEDGDLNSTLNATFFVRNIHGDVEITLAHDPRLDFEDGMGGAFARLNGEESIFVPWTARRRGERVDDLILSMGLAFSPTDRQVGTHTYQVVGMTGRTAGSPAVFIRVRNINDPTSVAAHGALSETGSARRVELPSFTLQDDDFRILTQADSIATRGDIRLTSGLNLILSDDTGMRTCTLPREERIFRGALEDNRFDVTSAPSIDLLASRSCAAIFYNVSRDQLSDTATLNDKLDLREVRLVDYGDPSGGLEVTTDTSLLIAQGQLSIPLDNDVDGDGVVNLRDNCPLIANVDQTDSNDDDFGDVCQPDDADFDTIPDFRDNCFGIANPDQTDSDGDSYGDACPPDPNMRNISTAAQLNTVRNNLGANYELLRDIDLSVYANWQPIGDDLNRFTGVFDGKGYTISNLSMNYVGTEGRRGLFAQIQGATIRNVTLRIKNIEISSENGGIYVGGLVGFMPDPSTIQDCAVILEGNISVSSNATNTRLTRVGGLIGLADAFPGGGTISRSYVLALGGEIIANVTAGTAYTGGLVGGMNYVPIENSYALLLDGARVAAFGPTARAGGLVGIAWYPIRNSYAVVNGSVVGASGVGGLKASGPGSVSNSYFATTAQNPALSAGVNYNRTLDQLECSTAPGQTCASAPAATYVGWDSAIWDFGDAQTLPDLLSNPRPADLRNPLP